MRAMAGLARRWRDRRLVRTSVYHLGELLGRRELTLIGRVPTGSRIALSSRDRQHRHIYFYSEHEPEVEAVIRATVDKGTTLFDVGANVGYFSLIARDLGGEVHAFEPNPEVFSLLEKSLSLDPHGVTPVQVGCSDTSGTATLFLQDESGKASFEKPSAQRLQVPVITLSDYWRDTGVTPDVMKVDVEGHEHQALLGAADLLSAVHPDLIVETTSAKTLNWLLGHGYSAHAVSPDGLQALPSNVSFAERYVNLYFSWGESSTRDSARFRARSRKVRMKT